MYREEETARVLRGLMYHRRWYHGVPLGEGLLSLEIVRLTYNITFRVNNRVIKRWPLPPEDTEARDSKTRVLTDGAVGRWSKAVALGVYQSLKS